MIPRRFHPPHPLAVWLADDGTVERFVWRRREHRVAATETEWSEDWGFWTADPVSRKYYRLRAFDGLVAVVYRDLLDGRWYLEQVLD